MPYDRNTDLPKSVRDALPEHAQTIFRKAYNSARKQYGAENETKLMQVAWAAVKNVYEKKDDKWILKKGKTAISNAFVLDSHDHRPAMMNDGLNASGGSDAPTSFGETKSNWIPIAKVGQPMNIEGKKTIFPTKEGFEMAVSLFNELKLMGYVSKNHSKVSEGLEMTEQKFTDPFLYAKFNSEGETAIKDSKSNGRSIDATVFALDGDQLTHFLVPGVSVLYGSHTPACTPQMGCASVVQKSTNNPKIDFDIVVLNNSGQLVKVRDVNLYLGKDEMKDEKIIKDQLLAEVAYLEQQQSCSFYKHDPKLKIGDVISEGAKPVHTVQIAISEKGKVELEYHKGGGIKKMAEKEGETVTYTGAQLEERLATAIGENEEKLNNAHEVALTALKGEQETKIEKLETEHAKIVKDAEDATTKLKEQIESELRGEIKTKLGMSDEVAKTLDVFSAEQLTAMKGWTMPVVATAATGISSASGGEQKPQAQTAMEEALGKLNGKYVGGSK